jgi:transcriptional regulator with XRE-family HTH domain
VPTPEPPPASIQRAFGERVRTLRMKAELRQEDLADRCGLYRTYLSRIENGTANPTLAMIQALADSLDVPITSLFPRVQGSAESPSPSPARKAPGSRGKVR